MPPHSLVRPSSDALPFNQQAGSGHRSDPELAAELVRGAANQMRSAFAISALQVQRSLETAFPGEPIREEWPELRAARSAMYLIGRAVERSILQPVWECPPPYRKLFHIRRFAFTLNATGLEGRALSWDDFGGLEKYLGLLEYLGASANAVVAGGTAAASRTLPKNPGSTTTAFGGVIGSPSLSEDGEESTPAVPPRGYPGDPPDRRLAPGAPPFLPPRVPDPMEDADSWDVAIRERSGLWHREQEPAGTSSYANGGRGSNGSHGSRLEAIPAGGLIRRFIAERCETGDERRALAGELYTGFLHWCNDLGHQPLSQRAFGMRLTSLGLRRKRRGHGKHWWEGIRLAV